MYQKSWWYDLQFLRCTVWQTEISNYGQFFALLRSFLETKKKKKKRILKKWKKLLEISSFHTYVSKITIIWYTVPESLSETDIIFCHFGHFLPFYLCNNPENQNFEKMKKTPSDIIILHLCTTNDNHMMYDSWDMECKRQFFVILNYWKTTGDIFVLHMCTINYDHMIHSSWDMVCERRMDEKSDIQRWVPHLKITKHGWIKPWEYSHNCQSNFTQFQYSKMEILKQLLNQLKSDNY